MKTALFGRDANWGRVLMAAGSAKFNGGFAELDPDRVSLVVQRPAVLAPRRAARASSRTCRAHCTIELDLGLGNGAASYLTTDLSYDYVRINAEYRT